MDNWHRGGRIAVQRYAALSLLALGLAAAVPCANSTGFCGQVQATGYKVEVSVVMVAISGLGYFGSWGTRHVRLVSLALLFLVWAACALGFVATGLWGGAGQSVVSLYFCNHAFWDCWRFDDD